MAATLKHSHSSNHFNDETLFEKITNDIHETGLSICPMALPIGLSHTLHSQLHYTTGERFEQAGIGRKKDHMHNGFVRTDRICWITGDSEPCQNWLAWASQLQSHLNRRLFLGLFSFESHFAHYQQGDFYKRHVDAFKGEANRILSVVVYLNPNWAHDQGGELVLYKNSLDAIGTRITPTMGTIVVFLSEEFPHEVLTTHRDRYSIAGWFRINSSTGNRVDPPK